LELTTLLALEMLRYFKSYLRIGLININYRDYLLAGISQNRFDWDYLLAGISLNINYRDCLLAGISQNINYRDYLLAGISQNRYD
jgi:hypothetical protein